MDTARRITPTNTESYRPKDKPVILDLAKEQMFVGFPDELLVEQINDFCSIVDKPEIKIVGVRIELTPNSGDDAIRSVVRLIKDGTCKLLEDLLKPKHPGEYIAAVSRLKSGIEFTYVIGIEVDSFDSLPDFLPPNTVTLTCPAARYGKVSRNAAGRNNITSNPKQSLCYLASSEFRNKTGLCYDITSMPFRLFDSSGDMTAAYEPVKAPKTEEEKFEQVGWEIVMLPELKVIGCFGENDSCMWNLFNIENTIDWKAAGCLDERQYYSFGCHNADGQSGSIFGRLVSDFDQIPALLINAVMPSGLWVRFYQKQINNDDPSIIFEGAKDLFFRKHPEFVEDYSCRGGLYIAQFEQGATFSFPIKHIE